MSNKLWWLASYPKSGNTWVRLFMSAYMNGHVDLNRVRGASWDDMQEYFYHVVSPRQLDLMEKEDVFLLRSAALLHLAEINPDGAFILVKTHYANGLIHGVDLVPKQLTHGAVYLVRDPRDVALSLAHHRGEPVADIVHDMLRESHCLVKGAIHAPLGTWSDHVRSWACASDIDVLLVRYEDLVDDPKTQFRAILEHLHFEVHEARLDAAVEATAFERLKAQEEREGFRERPRYDAPFFRSGKSGGWRNDLDPAQVERIEAALGETMREMGY